MLEDIICIYIVFKNMRLILEGMKGPSKQKVSAMEPKGAEIHFFFTN